MTDETCPDCRFSKNVHARYGMCPVVIRPSLADLAALIEEITGIPPVTQGQVSELDDDNRSGIVSGYALQILHEKVNEKEVRAVQSPDGR